MRARVFPRPLPFSLPTVTPATLIPCVPEGVGGRHLFARRAAAPPGAAMDRASEFGYHVIGKSIQQECDRKFLLIYISYFENSPIPKRQYLYK